MKMKKSGSTRRHSFVHLFAVASTLAATISHSAMAATFGGLDLSRGGIDSLSDASEMAPYRALIGGLVPGATFSGTDTLTESYLSTVDGVFLGGATSINSAITPLTSSEQSALFQFVLGGGSAIIGTDNANQSAGAIDAFNSLLRRLVCTKRATAILIFRATRDIR